MDKIIYLYVKTHNVTGLKYLGKYSGSDVYSYQGSGKRWTNHIRKHGYDVTTEILLETTDPEYLKKQGIYYSELWNVVKSEEWANLKIEEGDGGWSHLENIPDLFQKRSEWMLANNPFRGKKHTEETKQKIKEKRALQVMQPWSEERKLEFSEKRKGHYVSEETKIKMSLAAKGKPNLSLKGKPKSEEARMRMSLAQKKRFQENPNKLIGTTISEETKQKIRDANLGKQASEETKKKMQESQKKRYKDNGSPLKGRLLSEEHKKKIGIAGLGKKRALLTCPYCGKEGGSNAMKQWHFDNCKFKKD